MLPSDYIKLPTPQGARCVVFAIFQIGKLVVKMPTYPLQTTCLAVIAGTPVLAAVFVALRLYTRRKLNLRLGLGEFQDPSDVPNWTDKYKTTGW
jgi:hypothetical protein